MIKVIGTSFFFLLGAGFIYHGVTRGESGMVGVGGVTLFMAVLLLLGATVFRKTVDTEANARTGMKVIKAAVTGDVDVDD